MSEGSKGWVGSLVVHGALVALLVGASWWGAQQQAGNLDAVDPLLVDLNGIVGRKAGEVGREEGVAKGQTTGSRLFHFKPVDLDKIRREQQAENAGGSSSAGATQSKGSGSKTSRSSGSKESLDNFLNGKGTGRGTGTAAGISGVSLGRSTGTGDNGGDGGTASAQQMYAGEVLARFRQAWADTVTSQGEDLGTIQCGVKVSVSASGQVTFSGFISAPSSSKAATLVRRAVGQIGNCGAPPLGKAFDIEFPRVSTSE